MLLSLNYDTLTAQNFTFELRQCGTTTNAISNITISSTKASAGYEIYEYTSNADTYELAIFGNSQNVFQLTFNLQNYNNYFKTYGYAGAPYFTNATYNNASFEVTYTSGLVQTFDFILIFD